MQNKAIPTCLAMAIHILEATGRTRVDGVGCREEEVGLLLADGSVWILPSVLVPLGGPSYTLRGAAKSLERQCRGRRACAHWRMIAPPAKASQAPGPPAATAAR